MNVVALIMGEEDEKAVSILEQRLEGECHSLKDLEELPGLLKETQPAFLLMSCNLLRQNQDELTSHLQGCLDFIDKVIIHYTANDQLEQSEKSGLSFFLPGRTLVQEIDDLVGIDSYLPVTIT